MSEIANDKGTSVATAVNWLATLLVGFYTQTMVEQLKGWCFGMFGIFSIVGAVFVLIFMRETKGLSDAEVQRLYRTDADVIAQFEKKQALETE